MTEPSTPPEVALGPLRDRPDGPWLQPDLKSASLADLFMLYGYILDELIRREVVRTRNQPLGDYSEWLVWQALRGQQTPNKSEKSFDITADVSSELLAGLGPHSGGHLGARIQVKARSVSPIPKHHQLQTSPFHAHGFDYLALVLHEESDFSIRRAVLLPTAAALAHAKPASARRDDVLRLWMTPAVMDDPTAVDITEPSAVCSRGLTNEQRLHPCPPPSRSQASPYGVRHFAACRRTGRQGLREASRREPASGSTG